MFIINGSFLCRNLTGIERFALELCKQLDTFIPKDFLEIHIPKNAKCIPDFKNIKITVSKKNCNNFPIWEHIIFASYIRKNRSCSINFSNILPLCSHGYVFIHDIYAKLYPDDFVTFKEKLRRFYMCWMYKNACKHAKHIFTVSEFSKKQICDWYKISAAKITVIPNGWEHFKQVESDFSILASNNLTENDFYFTLGSLSKRKNLIWIMNYAKNHPDEKFAISGTTINSLIPPELSEIKGLPNIILLGYISDSQVKALMSKCKAFIFPSYYEGFGIPPLEALSVGAKAVVSNAASLPEIYGNCVHYIDPTNWNVSLEDLLNEKVDSPEKILSYYTYKNAAEMFYNEIR